ncbi:MAG: hypothetical protein AAF490_06375 [Chloroflexota bacterium]
MDASIYDQHVSAFLKDGVITLNTNAKTDDGLWYLQEPFVSIPVADGAQAIGDLLLDMLGQSQTAVSNDEFTQVYIAQVFSKMLEAVGVASVDELAELAQHCGVGLGNGRYELTPTKKVTTGEMFTFLEDKQVLVEAEEADRILGFALLNCFSHCE